MIGLLGKKLGMTNIFDESGYSIPVTVLEVGPCVVTAVRTKEKDGYNAVQLAYKEQKEHRLTKPELGVFNKINISPKKYLKEIRTNKVENINIGDELLADNFEAGDYVDVIGVSIGKGFQGVVKRHNFAGGPGGHGSKCGREPGSTGQSAYPSRIIKGKKMPGHMGAERVTTQNLKVVKVDAENNVIALKGSVPGAREGFVIIKNALKKGKDKEWKPVEKESEPEEKEEIKPVEEAESNEQAAVEEKTEAPKEETVQKPEEEKSGEQAEPADDKDKKEEEGK